MRREEISLCSGKNSNIKTNNNARGRRQAAMTRMDGYLRGLDGRRRVRG